MTQVPALYKRPISTFYVQYAYHRLQGVGGSKERYLNTENFRSQTNPITMYVSTAIYKFLQGSQMSNQKR